MILVEFWAFGSNSPSNRDRTLPTWRANLHKDLGPVIQEYSWFGKPSFVHVDDPDLIEFVTVKNNYIKNTEFVSYRTIYI
jgi:hypothetical protein